MQKSCIDKGEITILKAKAGLERTEDFKNRK